LSTKQWVCEVARFNNVIEIYYRPTLVTYHGNENLEFNTKLAITQVKLIKFKFKFTRLSKST